MTFSALLPYLLPMLVGYAVRHFEVASKLYSLLNAFVPNPMTTPRPPGSASSAALPRPAPTVTVGSHPVLSGAVNAAINQAVQDAFGGHVTSLKGELQSLVNAAVASAVADLKPKG